MLKNNYDDNPNMFRLKISQNVFVLKGHVFVRICACGHMFGACVNSPTYAHTYLYMCRQACVGSLIDSYQYRHVSRCLFLPIFA